jgi:acetyl-CoA acyltransferase
LVCFADRQEGISVARKVYVIGVGMTKFEKPGAREVWDYPDMAREAGSVALADAGIDYRDVEEAYVGYVYGESTSGQRAVYELGLSGIPVVNVNNNCSTGSTALYLATRAIRGGLADCALALGFEKMQPGSLASVYDDRAQPMEKHILAMAEAPRCSSRPRRGCSARQVESTCSNMAARRSISPGSVTRTTSTR